MRRRVRNEADADDIVQSIRMRLLSTSKKRPVASVQAWLYTAARNAITDHYRRRRITTPISDDLAGPEPSDPGVMRELSQCMQPMLQALPASDQELLRWVDIESVAQSQIALREHVPISTVKSRVQRARKRLRERLEACCVIELNRSGHPVGIEGKSCSSCREPATDGSSCDPCDRK